jgi:hypothetical protein
MPSDHQEPSSGVFGRIYSRHAKRGGATRGGRDEDRARGRDRDRERQSGRARKGTEADERDSEMRIRADATAIALRKRIEALPDLIDELDAVMRDSLTKAADGMREVPDRLEAKLTKLEDEATVQELTDGLALLEGEVEELEQSIELAKSELESDQVSAALKWAESYLALQIFPGVKQELADLGEALAGGYPVDLVAIARFCDTIEAVKADADAAVLALGTLRTDRDTKVLAAKASLKWFGDEIGRPLAGLVTEALQRAETADLSKLTATNFPASGRAAIQRDIDALAAWANTVDNGIRKAGYIGQILGACNDTIPFVTADGSKPPFATPKEMGDAFVAAVLMLPVDGADIAQVVLKAQACPGRWVFFIKKDAERAEQERQAQARDLAIAGLSTHLQTGAGWNLVKLPADALAKQMFAADAGALAKLTSSGLTKATWDLLTPYIGNAFENMAGIFAAIVQLKNEAALALMATQRLPYLALTPGNLNTILASGAAQLITPTSYEYKPPRQAATIGASVIVDWVGWMPGGAKAHAWGAVHFHFNGKAVSDVCSKGHIKDYELHTAGGMGKINLPLGGAGARQALQLVRAQNFKLS